MKNFSKTILFSLVLLGFMAFAQNTFSQPPPPPAEKGSSTNKGPNAPIDGGVVVALAMVAGYGAWKVYKKLQKA